MSTDDRIKILFELGEADDASDWPDYLQYGFEQSDIPALLALVADDALISADTHSNENWVPLHAWRTLGQIGSGKAVKPLIAMFDRACMDSHACDELPRVMGMIGKSAILPLAAYIRDAVHEERARSMAVDALDEIVVHDPSCRDQVIRCYQDYMTHPDETALYLNGMMVCCLIDLKAKEAIDDIRRLYETGCVARVGVGDLEDVEIELGIRTARSVPEPVSTPGFETQYLAEPAQPGSEDILATIDYYLNQYGNDNAIIDVSELDGFFTALACAPVAILPSRWMPALWGGQELAPEWETAHEQEEFSRAVFELYNRVMESVNEHEFAPLYLVNDNQGKTCYIVDDWCCGYLRGLDLWDPLTPDDSTFLNQNIKSIKRFALEGHSEKLLSMPEAERMAQHDLIEIDVLRVFTHFLEQRLPATGSAARELAKVGRNDPCPCGSGKKYKKCCLH